jgi:hypothetical protein
MELFSARFFPAVLQALDAGPLVLGTIPVPRYGRTIPQVRRLAACLAASMGAAAAPSPELGGCLDVPCGPSSLPE